MIGPYRIGRPPQVRFGPTFTLPNFEFSGRQEKKERLGKMSVLIMENWEPLPARMRSDNHDLIDWVVRGGFAGGLLKLKLS